MSSRMAARRDISRPETPTARAMTLAVTGASPVTITISTPSGATRRCKAPHRPRRIAEREQPGELHRASAGRPRRQHPKTLRLQLVAACRATAEGRDSAAIVGKSTFHNAQLRRRRRLSTAASDILVAGSNGTKVDQFRQTRVARAARGSAEAASTGSCPPSELASAARPRTRASSKPGNGSDRA